jgi:hypothetical protein
MERLEISAEEIDCKINELSKEQREIFWKDLEDSLYDRGWCAYNKIDYVDPSFSLAKVAVYKERYLK